HRSIHDDAVCTDLDRPAFRCQDGTETDRAVRADRNVAANNGRWRNPRRRMDARGDSIVVEKHHCLLFFASLAAGRSAGRSRCSSNISILGGRTRSSISPPASPLFNYNFHREDDTVKFGLTVSLGAPLPLPVPTYPVKARLGPGEYRAACTACS